MRVSALVIACAMVLSTVASGPAAATTNTAGSAGSPVPDTAGDDRPAPDEGTDASTPLGAQFPSASTTGLTNPGALTVHNGSMEVREAGAVIENLEIRGRLDIYAPNVTVRNVWVYTDDFWTILVRDGASAVVEDVEIGSASAPGQRGIGGPNVTLRRANIHHVEDGIKLGDNSTYDWVYCHDLASPSSQPHFDCVQNDGGSSNIVMTRMYLDPTPAAGHTGFSTHGNAALFVKSDLGPIDSVTITDSYLNAGGYTVFSTDGGYGPPTNVRVINNTFGNGHRWGVLHEESFIPWYGNTYETGAAVGRDGASQAGANPFSDAVSTPWSDAISWLNWAGISAGCGTNRFCPNDLTTRAQMASLLVRALPLASASTDTFTDDAGSVHEQNINSFAAAGITTGCGTGRFCPNSPVTRGQMATFLVNALDLAPSSTDYFTDDEGSVHEASINALAASGITSGCTSTRFCPDTRINRGQIAVMLQRAFDA